MSEALSCREGEWVEVEFELLQPEERASGLPADTAAQPLVVWVKGFLCSEASVGETVTVETITGRFVEGRLVEINPGYFHTFGNPIPELNGVGRDLRARLEAYRAGGE